MQVTWASVGLWFGLVALWQPAGIALYVMRPVYLAIVGYLIGYLGEERRELEREVNAFEIDEQRLQIARDLHDGYAQVLGAVNLQLESYGRLLRTGRRSRANRARAVLALPGRGDAATGLELHVAWAPSVQAWRRHHAEPACAGNARTPIRPGLSPD